MTLFLNTTLVILLGGLVGFSATYLKCVREKGSTIANEHVGLASLCLVGLGAFLLVIAGIIALL